MGRTLERLESNLPPSIKTLDRFVLWRFEQTPKDKKPRKVPYAPNERRAATNKPGTWSSFSAVIHALEARPDFFSGIGIVLGDGIMGIDLDHVIDEEGNLSSEAAEIVEEIPGYVEISPSGSGLHLLTRAALPQDRGQIKFGGVEFYDETSPRYLTLTGDVWRGRSALGEDDASDAVAYVYRKVRGEVHETPPATGKVDLNDNALLKKIRSSKQGEKFSALYDRGDWKSISYPSASEGVAALLAILAFWTGKDEARIDRLFRGSALYDAEKWNRRQSGSTLGRLEIHNACSFCKETFGALKLGVDFPDIGPRGAVLATIPNLEAALEYHGITVRYDEVQKVIAYLFEGDTPFSLDNQNNASLGQLMSLLESDGMPTTHLQPYIYTVADLNRINPVRDWIVSKEWDGLDRLLPICDTVEAQPDFPSDMKELLIEKWLLSAVAAACHDPRVKPFMARGVLTLTGAQYIGKTRWLESLAPIAWVKGGHNLDTLNKDSVKTAISHWICELGELESSFKKDIGRLKAFLTLEFDYVRIPFSVYDSKFPRRTIFAASVNRKDFLLDETGNSRFWVIPVVDVQHDHNIDMQQVFAQLYVSFQRGAQWWLTPEENARLSMLNEPYEERDEVFDLVTSRIDWSAFDEDCQHGYVEWLTPTDVLISWCGIEHPTKGQRNSCARILRKLTGLEQGKRAHRGGSVFPIPKRGRY